MNGYFLTDKGKVRDHNEDAGGFFFNAQQQALAVIADGMGGHKAGDVASQMVIESLKEKWNEMTTIVSPDQAENWLSECITETNHLVYGHAKEHEDCAGMGTTIVAVICTVDFITIAHIGDSRCYLYNAQGFKQVTEDHSLVNELVRSGQITKDDAEYHPRKNVLLKALGTEQNVQVDIQTIGWEPHNKLLLCSDGLSNKISEIELDTYIDESLNIEETAHKFIELANERGGEDNISIVLVEHNDSQEEGEL
ncbi:Stp1/IreP family PP2C-type Ser/Thr phosphatase [Aquibacillus koreensis]|uniref:protein-serine/threonine phosphatase n=1 Tax=Aquibacillus koreensis TaxID=279446 RepID=A0A9X3WNH2_9BACI|nr:Stp1/IreP family PP2C-type Ser/Thr phosphatase [Aquibacillus koreensis]MCT2538016.1 Stp1/IreP family PP2C-type Ser/Thr phosphatase [Aquibacillus koreensis]MDC3420539.1 Stp1/IreP family PP2C-type Ser/Thr phosphatase [Aquibacillus koreensis]